MFRLSLLALLFVGPHALAADARAPAAASYSDRFRKSGSFAASKTLHAPGSTANCRVADPRLDKVFCTEKNSPLVGAGIELPPEWPDPLRKGEKDKPDVGALPYGVRPLEVGPNAIPVRNP